MNPAPPVTRANSTWWLTERNALSEVRDSCIQLHVIVQWSWRHWDGPLAKLRCVLRSLVTGAAGFIGSHLCSRLLSLGEDVVGVDSFTPYYSRALKEAHLAAARQFERFRLIDSDLNDPDLDLDGLLDGVDVIYHQAGQPGVRSSWGESFEPYLQCNIRATQRLLEAARRTVELRRFVYASSSSVYGDAAEIPFKETTLPHPVSPYGVTKLAAEHLCTLYAKLGVPTVSLRYFTVYGPGQRPDMAFSRFIAATLCSEPITINGDGEQSRDFTYVEDIVAANVSAGNRDVTPGSIYNLAGGSSATVNKVIAILADIAGRSVPLLHVPQPDGESRITLADISLAQDELGFQPSVALHDGLQAQFNAAAKLTRQHTS